jgi:5-methylthioadenosine/S-adenosylhomocysteine deaminase
MGLVITDVELDGARVGIGIESGRVARVGPEVQASPGDEALDGRGMVALPGLVNGHTHAAMTLLRGYGDDLPLMTWLQTRIWPAEARLEPDDVYWGARLACLEMLRSGTTSFVDMYWHAPATARAVEETGLRATVGVPLIDRGDSAGLSGLKDEGLRSLDELGAFGSRITPSLAPHAVYTVSRESLEWIGIASAEREVPVHIHLAETRREVDDCVVEHGLRPAELADRCGLLGPRTVLAHGCWLEPHELDLIAERGATVVTNPVSNMKLAVGRQFPYLEAAGAGVQIGLGTDGAASNNSLDLFQDMKVFALAQKFAADDPAVLPASEVLAIATGQRSAFLGGRPVEAGAPADLVLVRTDLPEVEPGDRIASLVYAATGAAVNTVIVDGEIVMHGREVAGEEEVMAEVRARAERVRVR